MKHDANSSYGYPSALCAAEFMHGLTYRLHGHLAPPPTLLVRERGVRADEDVVRLRQLDGLVHDREVATVQVRSEDHLNVILDS